jgi:hypothetical protein
MRSLALALALTAAAFAQNPGDPPPLLQLVRIPKGDQTQRPYQSAKAGVDVIGMASMTGLPETWLIESHQTFGSIEDLDSALRAHGPAGPANQFGEARTDELLGSPRTMVAAYLPELSIRPGEATRILPKSRFFRVSIYRMTAAAAGMQGMQSSRRREYEGVNLDRPELVYRVISGSPASTYLVLAPLTSLRQIDEGLLRLPSYLEPLMDSSAGDAEVGREHLLFRVDPQVSYVSPAFAAEDAEFWKPRRQ